MCCLMGGVQIVFCDGRYVERYVMGGIWKECCVMGGI